MRHFWERNDVKGAINAVRKLPDHSVGICCCSANAFQCSISKFFLKIILPVQMQADVVGVLIERMEIITLDIFSCLLPVLLGLLESKAER